MDSFFQDIQASVLNHMTMIKSGGIILLGIVVISLLGRFIFGRNSVLTSSVSTAIGIIFVYVLTVVAYTAGNRYSFLISPLPFISISADQMILFQFQGAQYTLIFAELASMVIFAFFVSLADNWMPIGKNLVSWLFFRCVTVAVAFGLHLLINWLLTSYLPEGIITYAPVILLGLLILMILTGALKFLVGLTLTTVNPLIAAFYTFFFANMVGKQITRAVLTTALLVGVVYALYSIGCSTLPITRDALCIYIPFLAILLILWRVVSRKL